MPTITFARKKSKRAPRKKRTKKISKAAPLPVSIVQAPRRRISTFNSNIGLPATKRVKLSYYDNIGLTSVSGTLSLHAFNLASIADSDYTGIGHQCYGRDEWANLYRQYYVSSAKISVKFSNSQSNNMPHKVGLILDKDASLSAIRNTRLEQTKGRGQRTLLANSNNTQTVTAYYNPKSFFSIKDPKDDHQIKALLSASPTLPAYGIISVQAYDNVTTSSAAVYAEVMIEYNVVLSDPVINLGS